MLMTSTATDLTTNPSEECPRVDHAIFYYKTCHYLSQAGTLAGEGMTPLSPPLLGKAIKLSFSTSPKTLSLRFGLAPAYSEAELSASVIIFAKCMTKHFIDIFDGSDDKDSTCNVGNLGLIPGLGRSPAEGNGYPLQYSCLENSMDRGAWQPTVHGVEKSWT